MGRREDVWLTGVLFCTVTCRFHRDGAPLTASLKSSSVLKLARLLVSSGSMVKAFLPCREDREGEGGRGREKEGRKRRREDREGRREGGEGGRGREKGREEEKRGKRSEVQNTTPHHPSLPTL